MSLREANLKHYKESAILKKKLGSSILANLKKIGAFAMNDVRWLRDEKIHEIEEKQDKW